MKTRIFNIAAIAVCILVTSTCVQHRDTRFETFSENIYLDKDFLTRANPNAAEEEYGWLLGLSVAAVSVPAPISDIFPGLQGDVKYVRFGFSRNTMQIVDGIVFGGYDEESETPNLVDPRDAADLAPRVLQEYDGDHVDIQLRRNLDGEVTNYIEEYKERDWERRQYFKFNPEDGAFSDLSKVSWYYDWAVSPAMTLMSSSLVPNSFHYVDTVAHETNFGCADPDNDDTDSCVDWDRGDYMEWTTRLTYAVDVRYGSLMNFRLDTDTQTVDIKYSLWRRADPENTEDAYVTRPIKEKGKYVRKFGIWNYVVHNYQDEETGFMGATKYLSRYNPNLPIDFYMIDVPREYAVQNPEYTNEDHPDGMSVYESVAYHANQVFDRAGVEARVNFYDADEGDVVRKFGDIRYSFVVWHNNPFTDIPWLGYGPSWMEPRTGEIINATLNFNNWQGLHWYTYVARDLLEQISDAFDEEGTACTAGEIRPVISDDVRNELQNTTLFSKMVSYMDQEPEDWVPEHTPEFDEYYHMLLNDVRYFYPPYQTFVYSGREAGLADMQTIRQDLMERDQEFWNIAASLDSIESPWGTDSFFGDAAIEKGLDFINRSKDSMSAHHQLMQDREVAAGMHGICLVDGPSLLGSIAWINQRCKSDGTWQTFEEWEDDVRWRISHQTSIHELGHNIGQWHNFYGSVDSKHYAKCTGCGPDGEDEYGPSSSVMDYVHHFAEAGADLGYWPYDWATLIYGYRYDSQEEVDEETDDELIRMLHPEWNHPANGDDPCDPTTEECPGHPENAMLFANDYHRPLSPLVNTFDLGVTPSEHVMNHIQYYDWMYQFRNFRSYRQYWETWGYPNSAFGATFPLRRFLELWTLDWNEEDLENDLRLLGVTEEECDLFCFYNLRDEFNEEMGQANRMIINFYQAILTQSNAERSYATTYDSFFGDVTRIGIIYDKYYAMMSFLGLWGADSYNLDVYAYLAYYEFSWGKAQTYSDALTTLDAMLGGSYDVYTWFLPTAVLLFAQDTHGISFGD
ncbi:MAG: zinc-dependent metalloprotease, partial [Deltaproteobacteria bacterium]|nr:zinc-dependent metalloprotease [Deltaproteobacteria bacterium]